MVAYLGLGYIKIAAIYQYLLFVINCKTERFDYYFLYLKILSNFAA